MKALATLFSAWLLVGAVFAAPEATPPPAPATPATAATPAPVAVATPAPASTPAARPPANGATPTSPTPVTGAATQPATTSPGPVMIVPVKEEISEAQFLFLRLAVKEAQRRGASAVVLHMDTWGGRVDAAIDNMQALLKLDIPTYTYVDTKAISAGALIALATNKIYMAPAAVIGASALVGGGGEELPQTIAEKQTSMTVSTARIAAERNGHNPDLADAFIRRSAELKIGDAVLDKPDTLLTLNTSQAMQLYDGKPLLAAGVAKSLEEMLQMAGLTGPAIEFQPSGFQWAAVWITALAPLLLIGGIVCAWLEIKTPGFGFFGITSVICFTLFFAGHYLAGLAGWEVVILFLAGFILVLVEVLLIPGTIIAGVSGIVLMLIGLIWAMVDRYPGESWWPDSDLLTRPLLNIFLAFIGAGIVAYFLGKYFPQIPLFRWLVLSETTPHGSGPMLPTPAANVLTGASGIARTTLRPAGKADFGGRMLDVVTQGDYIDAGQSVRVVAVEGQRVVVEAVR